MAVEKQSCLPWWLVALFTLGQVIQPLWASFLICKMGAFRVEALKIACSQSYPLGVISD